MSRFLDALGAIAEQQAREEQGAASVAPTTPARGRATGDGDPEIQSMKAQAPLLDLIRADTGEDGREMGGRIDFHRCPVCGHLDCFRFYPKTNSWTCFGDSNATGCEGGSYVDYIMATRGTSLREAMGALREATGYERAGQHDGRPDGAPTKRDAGEPGAGAPLAAKAEPEPVAELEPVAEPDGLPPLVPLRSVWQSLPPRAEPIIGDERDGLLRRGHVLLINAPSKAGKSWLLDELGVSMSLGLTWLGYRCRRQPVLFCDFELDRPSFYHRIRAVADAMGGSADPALIDTISLRGHVAGTGELADHIIRQASTRAANYYGLLVLDPLYMFATGDENSAGDTREVMRQIGRLATTLGCAVAISHHNAKGAAGAKASIDRGSGSGVFARFPDALLDLAPVSVPPEADLDPDATVWRLTPTLREFRPQKPTTWVFRWPLHVPYPEGDEWPVIGSPEDNRRKGGQAYADAEANKRAGRISLIGRALDRCDAEGTTPTPQVVWGYYSELSDEDVTLSTFKSWLKPSRPQYPFNSIRDGPGFVVARTDEA